MNSLTQRAKFVAPRKMTLLEKIYLPAIASGLMVTFGHLFRSLVLQRKVTIQYPEVKKKHAPIYRGQHVLKRDDAGAERCTACGLCALACPAEAITMTASERKKGEEKLYREEKYASVYEINMLRCIFCGLCEEACPKEAIFLTDRIVKVDVKRGGFIYGKDRLVEAPRGEGRIDVTPRQAPATLEFKKDPRHHHNQLATGSAS